MANYRVLIIDDAFFIRNLIKKAIAKKPVTKDNTFEVVGEAQDGRSGIDLCESLKPDIITVDFNIPTINGLDFAKYLKELHPEIPLIMISSNLDPDFAKKVKDARCKLLTKPFQEAYLWKILDESVEEILNTDASAFKPKVNIEAQKILEELAEEMQGEIVPLKDERKDISMKGLADKNIKQVKAKNVGFDYSGEVLEIKSERRRMSSELILETEKKPEESKVVPDIPFSQIDIANDVDLEDEDDYIIDLDAVENQRESEYGKTGIEELEDEEFIFIDEEDGDDENTISIENDNEKQDTLLLDFSKPEDIVEIYDDDEDDDEEEEDIFLIEDEDENEETQPPTKTQIHSIEYEELLNTVTFNYYDYLGNLLYTAQKFSTSNNNIKEDKDEQEDQQSSAVSIREETTDEEFDRLFNEFNGKSDLHFDNPNTDEESEVQNKQNDYQQPQFETVLNRDREHISIDPPKDSVIFKVYGTKLADVTSAETFEQLSPPEPEPETPVKKKGFFARLLDKIFKKK